MPENQISTVQNGNGSAPAPVVPTSAAPVQANAQNGGVEKTEKAVFSVTRESKTQEGSAVSFLSNLMKKEGAPSANADDVATPASAPPAAPAPGTPPSRTEGNVFTDLFGKKSESNGNASQQISQEQATQIGFVSAPSAIPQKSLFLKRKFDEIKERKHLQWLKTGLVVLLFAVVLGLGYLFIELQSQFTFLGKTAAQTNNEDVEKLKSLQSNLNESHLRLALLHLTRVNLLGDAFSEDLALTASSKKNANEKLAVEARLGENREAIKQSLQIAADMFRLPLTTDIPGFIPPEGTTIDQIFEDQLKNNLQEKKKQTQDSVELRRLDNLDRLVSAKAFRNSFRSVNATRLTDTTIEDILAKIRAQSTDDFSIIAQLKQQRIRWSDILDHLDDVTRQVDKIYGQGLFNKIGGIQYSSYELNADAGTISIDGQVKTEDTKTFSLMVDLVDALEKSPYFKEVAMREFSKSKASEKSGYSGSIRLTFKLQKVGEKDSRDESIAPVASLTNAVTNAPAPEPAPEAAPVPVSKPVVRTIKPPLPTPAP